MTSMTMLLGIFDGTNPVIEVFHEGPDNPFICAAVGEITIDCLQRIENECYDVLDSGYGIYKIKCVYNSPYINQCGFIEGDYWELEVLAYEEIAAGTYLMDKLNE